MNARGRISTSGAFLAPLLLAGLAGTADARERPERLVLEATPAECERYQEGDSLSRELRAKRDTLDTLRRRLRDQCRDSARSRQDTCIPRIDSTRKVRLQLVSQLDSLDRILSPYSLVCSKATLHRLGEISRLDSMSREVCSGGAHPDPMACESVLFDLSKLQLDQDRLFDILWREGK